MIATIVLADGIEYRVFNQNYVVSHLGEVLKGLRPYTPRMTANGYLIASHSEESKLNRSLTHTSNTSCVIDGITYRSFAEAARLTGIHRFTIRKRCLSKNFPNYVVVPH